MTRIAAILLLALAAPGLPAFAPSALAKPGTVQGQVRADTRTGAVKPTREIEQRVLPSMRGMQYLGPEYDPAAMVYRLKFIRQGRVVFVDVDARSGAIISQSR